MNSVQDPNNLALLANQSRPNLGKYANFQAQIYEKNDKMNLTLDQMQGQELDQSMNRMLASTKSQDNFCK
jgi:hypothetical protein